MRKTIAFIVLLSLVFLRVSAQQKPIIMVVPDKDWCIMQGYVKPGTKQVDYDQARQNTALRNVCVEMGAIMSDLGYDLVDFASSLDEIANEKALDMTMVAQDDGAILEDDYDKLLRVANCDVAVNISFTEDVLGPRRQYHYIVKAIDAASQKQKSGFTGDSSPSNVPAASLLKESVYSYMDKFSSDIQRIFDDAKANGREGNVTFKIADTCPLNMESKVSLNGEEGSLAEVLDYWFNENTVNGSYTAGQNSRVKCEFKQVRFPLFGKAKFGGKAKALDINSWLTTSHLDSFLSQFGVSCSFKPIGIGKCYVVLGGQ